MASESRFSSDQSVSVVDVLLFPLRAMWGFAVFMVSAWTTSRDGRAFLFSIPAIGSAVVLIALVWVIGYKGESRANALSYFNYNKMKDPNEARYDLDGALMFAKKLVDLQPENRDLKYELGDAYAQVKNDDRAFNIMNYLAPDVSLDSAEATDGLSRAHLWLSAYHKKSENGDLEEDQWNEVSQRHVELAYKSDKTSVAAVLEMATIRRAKAAMLQKEAEKLRQENQPELADEKEREADRNLRDTVKYLNEAIDLPTESAFQLFASTALINILQDLGNDEEARLTGLRFINKYEGLAVNSPDALPIWITIAQACILIKDFDRGEKFIKQGYQLASNPEVRDILLQLAAQIDVEKSKSFDDMENEAQFAKKLYALCNAIIANVQTWQAHKEMLYFVDGFESASDQDDWLRDAILGSLTSEGPAEMDPRIPGIIHVVLGLREIVAGNSSEGKKHWEIASQQYTYAPYAINILVRIYDEERELDKATRLELIAAAIEQFPQVPLLYATRGKFHQEEGDFENAAEDFEFAAARIPRSLPILKELVACYKETGDDEKLAKYEKEVAEIEAIMARTPKGVEAMETFSSGGDKKVKE